MDSEHYVDELNAAGGETPDNRGDDSPRGVLEIALASDSALVSAVAGVLAAIVAVCHKLFRRSRGDPFRE
jgi:hypothetical protein